MSTKTKLRAPRHHLTALRAMVLVASVVLLVMLALVPRARAAGETPVISYDGNADELSLKDADGNPTANLFPNFTKVVPGDTIEQDVEISLTGITEATSLYVEASTTTEVDALLKDVTLSAELEGTSGMSDVPATAPGNVFGDRTLVATVSSDTEATLHLTLAVPTSVGNEIADQTTTINWVITVEEVGGGGAQTQTELFASHLTAYEGGLGTGSVAGEGETGDALPEPVWVGLPEGATITVNGSSWDVDEYGLPFAWYYCDAETGEPVTESARVGKYALVAKPLEEDPRTGASFASEPTVLVNGDLLVLPADGLVKEQSGVNVEVRVRYVTDNDAADSLSATHFKTVYGSEAPALLETVMSLMGFPPSGSTAREGSALENDFGEHGTAVGSCDSSESHAHVARGTTFIKNGNASLPVNDGSRVALLWDDFIPGVLGVDEREGALDAKARAAAGSAFAGDDVKTSFKYLDLVDMNDGNLWVATADGSSVQVFVPYFDDVTAESDIAVVDFSGLTRDYTVDMDASALDRDIANTVATSLAVTKASDGFLFEVPYAQFGPFELLWTAAGDDEPGTDEPGTDEPGPDEPGTDEPGPDEPGPDEPGGGEPTDPTPQEPGLPPHTEFVPHTGEQALTAPVVLVVAAVLVLVAAVLLRRGRSRKDSSRR